MPYANHVASLLVVLSALSLCMSVQAQAFETGVWTGEIIGPDGQVNEVTYEVAVEDDILVINIVAPNAERIPFKDVRLEDGTLTYNLEAGVSLECTLTLKDSGRYEGLCRDAQGNMGQMIMIPPQGEHQE